MESLDSLLSKINECGACSLMGDNAKKKIKYIPVCPKPGAKIIFLGRDPSPNTVKNCVGERGGDSSFINGVYDIVSEAGITDKDGYFYITDICKCHWRTSRGTPIKGTEQRKPRIPRDILSKCIQQWLIQEVRTLEPLLVVGFGEEVYGALKDSIIDPAMPPKRLSASRDKSKEDAELWMSQKGIFTIRLGDVLSSFAVLRHPGNSTSLAEGPRKTAHENARRRIVYEIANLKSQI